MGVCLQIENVCDLELDKPTSIIIRYSSPNISPVYRAMVGAYFKHEMKNNRIDVHEPPASFQPRMFPRRELERRFERASKSLTDIHADK